MPRPQRHGLCIVVLLALLALGGCDGTASGVALARQESMTTSAETAQEEPASASLAGSAASAAMEQGKINLNDMTREELRDTIPDFSNRMVREFFEYQPYISIQQFRREIGKYVDDGQVAFYEQYVFVPVDINESDSATLAQIPGVDDARAEVLMASRPFASPEAFLEALSAYLTPEQISMAASYLSE